MNKRRKVEKFFRCHKLYQTIQEIVECQTYLESEQCTYDKCVVEPNEPQHHFRVVEQ